MKHKMWSRLLSMVLAVMMIASIVPSSAFAEATSEIVASSQATVEVAEETEEVTLPEDTTTEEPAAETPAEEPAAETPAEEPAGEPAPTAEPVAEPTAEPVTESEQPAAEPTQAPAETAVPSEQPSAEPTAAPEGTETPEGTAVPTETPAASATPAPSESPVPSETPLPSETPAPSEEPAIDGQALLDELMAIEDDEAFLKAVSELTEEQTATLEALGEEALAEYTLRVENAKLAVLLNELEALEDDAFEQKFASLTDEEKAALGEFDAERFAALENRYDVLTYVSPVFTVSGTAPTSFLQVGPLLSGTMAPMRMMANNALPLAGEDEAKGLEVDKTVTPNKDGTYTLNLEAYATGDLEIVTESKPTDIVLVLDQSGSMADPFAYDYKVDYEPFNGSYSEAYRNPTYHLADDGTYHELNASREFRLGWPTGFEFTFTCDTCEKVIHTKRCWAFGWTTGVEGNSGVLRRVTYSTEIPRVNALKDAVNSFITSVREDATTNDVNHRVAIVGFASKSGYGNNTEILSIPGDNSEYGSNDNDSVGKAYNQLGGEDYKQALVNCNDVILDNAIKAIATNGATRADLGMEMAKKILEANPTDGSRNQVVILFTDGEPTSGNQFENGVANGAISNAKTLKDNNTTVYTIGIFNNANVEGNDNPNRYMQYVSSNYPDATSMGSHGNGNDKGGYYLVAKDAGELEDIFEKISGEVGGTSSTLDEKAVLRDVISPYFEMVYKEDGQPDVKVFTADCTGKTGTKYTFGNFTQVTDGSIKATVSSDGTTVDVTGFNYKENFVGEVKDGDQVTYRGKKLMVQITIKQKDAFLGGNNVPTNVTETSGIYKDNQESTPVKTFPQPTVDVPLKYTATKNDKTIYLSNSANLMDLVNETTDHYADLGRGAHANDYAKITYTFTAGGESWSYVIDPKVDKGTWADNSGAAVSPDKCTQYTVAVKVEPSVSKEGAGVEDKNFTLTPQIHVVAPEIWWQDSTAKYGQELDGTYYEQNNLVPNKITWTKHVNDNAADCSGAPTVSGDEPTLIYQYTATGKDGTTTLESLTEEANVKVRVFVGAVADGNNITSKVKFKWEDCAVAGCDTDPNPAFQFRVHLDSGKLTITKTVTDWNNAKGDQATFFFEITDVNGKIYEQALTVSKTNKTATATMTLPAGTYTVEELNGTSGYQFSGSTLVYAGGTAGEVGGQTVSNVKVGGAVPTVTFTNTTNGDNKPGDNGALNNWFKYDKTQNQWIWKLNGWQPNVAG
ncbi:VWA domain-containing protein [Fournierella sp.]|uniref:VWA domain-containing protein n=1 Tax=Allofournierella sp. TaxID=1940256 RepID=UPI00307A8A0A